MSLTQILEAARSFPTSDLESLEHSLRLERLKRQGYALGATETALFESINQPMPDEQRYHELTPAWEAGTLSQVERAELLEIVEAREAANARRVAAVMELARLRGVEFAALWRQIMGAAPEPRVIGG